MLKKYEMAAVGAILLGLGLTGFASAEGNCVPIKGKIFNNALGGSTLGTAHVNFDNKKFKCGLQGVGKNFDENDPNDIGPLNFDHTMVCDDDEGDTDPIHSQLLWDTSGYPTAVLQDCGHGLTSFSFLEESRPVTGTGRFAGVTGGQITVEGTLFCSLAIDMTFSGELCF